MRYDENQDTERLQRADLFLFTGETAEVTAELGRDLVNGGLAEEIKTASARTKAGVKDNAEAE